MNSLRFENLLDIYKKENKDLNNKLKQQENILEDFKLYLTKIISSSELNLKVEDDLKNSLKKISDFILQIKEGNC